MMLQQILVLGLTLVGLSRSAELAHGRLPSLEAFEADMNDVHFLLWTNNNPDDSYELIIDDATNLAASPFDVNLPTYVLAHGWNANGHSGWPVDAKEELMTHYDCNVIAIDWGDIAQKVNYFMVVNDLPEVGQHAANFLDFLHNEGGLDITSIHFVGHSLGAHLGGFIGSKVINGPLGRITGLDPAGPEFYDVAESERIDPSDAIFVEIIHSNGGPILDFCVDLEIELGHVDYYPNGGDHQPGCSDGGGWEELLEGGCSHGRAHKYWTESINGATAFTSVPCPDPETYEAGGCPDCGQGCLDMGMHASTDLRGTYFLKTNEVSPFAKG